MKLESRVTQLLEWSSKRSIITLSSDKLNTYARSKPRNYSIVAMFTALNAQRQCSVCKDAHDEFKVLADSWRFSQQYTSQVFFVMVDIDEDGMDAFQQVAIALLLVMNQLTLLPPPPPPPSSPLPPSHPLAPPHHCPDVLPFPSHW